MLKAKDLKDQSSDELIAQLAEKRSELFGLVNKRAREKKLENPGVLRVLKKDIARILTVLREKELANVEGT